MLRKIKQQILQGKTLLQFGFLKALGIAAPLVIAKFFSEELFGSYVLAKMIVFFFASLLIASGQAPFIVFANQERAKTGKINKSCSVQVIFFVFSLIVFIPLTLIFADPIKAFAGVSSSDLFFMSLGFIGIAIKSFMCNLFMALGQRIKNSLVELVFGSLTLGLVLLLSLTDTISLGRVFLVYFIAAVVVAIVFIKALNFNQLLPFNFVPEHFKAMFDFTKWIMLGATAVYLINWIDNIILKIFNTSFADIGQYGLGFQIFKGVVMLTSVLNAYFLPFVSEHIEDSAKIRNYLYNKRPKIFLLGLIALALLIFVAPYVFRLVYVEAYADSIPILRILLLGCTVILYNTFYIPILNALKKYKFTLVINLTHILIKVILDIILIPPYGLYGAAIATVIAYLSVAVMLEAYFRLHLKKILKL